jgi:hypothetical protein
LVPAATLLALPFGLRTRAEEKNVRAVYLFHRNGDPLVTVASDSTLPFESSHLEPVLDAVRDFVEGDDASSRRVLQKTVRFGEEGVVGVRGQFVSACVVFHGRGDGIIRRDLIRFVRGFEERNEERLGTWEDATSLAGEASLAMTGLMDNASSSPSAGFEFAPAAN